ncbi:MAG: GAF domain-containing sensor histidine kinase, partial [Verrucomicrobiota bacterium]
MPSASPVTGTEADDLFAGGGEMGRRMRAYDWASHPLGPPERWPQSLRTVMRILLTSRYAMWMGWGPEFWFFCNDTYLPTLGIKEKWALGASARKVWEEIWPDVGPRAESVVETGKATWDEGLRLFLERSGYPEETYHTFSYSPVPDDSGCTGGMLCVVTEETERVIGQRRLTLLRELAAELANTKTEKEVFAAVRRSFGAHPEDLPFALAYSFEPAGGTAHLVCAHGVEDGHLIAPASLSGDGPVWPAATLLAHTQPITVDLTAHAEKLPRGSWDIPPGRATVVPLTQPGQPRPAGFLAVGLNPYRGYDEAYRGFIDLLAGQISAGLNGARAYETERKRAAALAELDRAKTEFFSNVSHEFRTPLTLMLAPLEDELRERPERSERLETAHRNSLRLLKLVNTLLDFSRSEAGRLEASCVPTDIGTLTADLASSFRAVIEKAGIRFSVDCPALPPTAYVDREMWEKIVFNLLSNAFKFTFSGEIEIATRTRGDMIELTVRDSGTGIPAKELPRLFERFHRVQGARSRTHEGTGIGLALVNQLVRLHGGDVKVESTEGKGTTFTVTLRTGSDHLPADRVSRTATPTAPASRGAAFIQEADQWQTDTRVATGPDSTLLRGVADAALPARRRIVLAEDNADMRTY